MESILNDKKTKAQRQTILFVWTIIFMSLLTLPCTAIASDLQPFTFPEDIKELTTRITFCSTLVRTLNEREDNHADELYGRICISDEILEADILRARAAHQNNPDLLMLLDNLPPYKD
jgi:hypothetical protein